MNRPLGGPVSRLVVGDLLRVERDGRSCLLFVTGPSRIGRWCRLMPPSMLHGGWEERPAGGLPGVTRVVVTNAASAASLRATRLAVWETGHPGDVPAASWSRRPERDRKGRARPSWTIAAREGSAEHVWEPPHDIADMPPSRIVALSEVFHELDIDG